MLDKRAKLTTLLILILLTSLSLRAYCQMKEVIPLYTKDIPNSKIHKDEEWSEVTKDSILIVHQISRPSLTVYKPKVSNGTAVIIFPGGGYWIEAAGHEGADVAKKLNEMHITAFVLKYRIPDSATMINKEIGAFQDAQRAIQLVRENADKWKIKKNKIGILGFSAGGHLASTVGTHFDKSYIENPKYTSLRPDFMILIYPVISFTDSIGHIGSRDQIIGKHPTDEKIKEYSNEMHISSRTPPTFLVHAKDDNVVNVKNSIYFANNLQQYHVPHQLYLYEKGGHGFGMINKTSDVHWTDLLKEWLIKQQIIPGKS